MRTNDGVWKRSLWSVVVGVAALGLTAASAAAQTHKVNLYVGQVVKTVTLPSGRTVDVPMWGFGCDGSEDANLNSTLDPGEDCNGNGALDTATQPPTIPGPRIALAPGEQTLEIHLRNALPSGSESVSIVIPGQKFAATPVRVGGRIVSMTAATAPGSTSTYTFTSVKPGTFLYQSGSHPAVQVQMGLYGAMTKDASAGNAYASVPYAHEVLLVYSEIDPVLHQAVQDGTYGTPAGPTSTVNYKPTLFLVNGESFSEASAAIPAGLDSQAAPTLLRFVNAGLRTHVPQLDNGVLRIVAEDGNKLPFAKDQAGVMLPAGKTHDVLWTPTAAGTYSLYDRMLSLNAPGQGEAGMLARLSVGATGAQAVTANNDAYSTAEGATLTVPANGVLGNDSGSPTAAVLGATTHSGTLVLAGDGGFTYTPSPGFFGVDSFSYTASNGSSTSALALVSISVIGNPQGHPPVAAAQTVGVEHDGNVNVTLAATDPDGDALKYYLTSLPGHGTLSYVNSLTKVETPLVLADSRTVGSPAGTGGQPIPGGLVIYRPTSGYSGADSFSFVAYDGGLDSAQAQVSATVHEADQDSPASDLSAEVFLTVKGADGTPISNYRWTLEEDLTYKVTPEIPDPNTLAVRFHTSYTPVVASGTDADPIKVNPEKRYFISVLPTVNDYSMSGAEIEVGQGAVTVTVAKLPLPTARIRVQVFEDNAPLDGMYSGTENGLQGFQVTIDDAGGTYGMSGGHQSTDAVGNKIGTTYKPCDPGPCDSYQVDKPGDGFVLTDADGFAVIENLPMGKYTVKVRAPGGVKWIQTTTIEGTPGIDAWVKPNEPQFFTEFGPPGPHVQVGFVRADDTVGTGSGSITGRVTNMRMSRPPDTTQSSGAPFAHTRPWVALNSAATGGSLLYAQPVNADGTFTIPNVAEGNYSLVVFDSQVDLIIANRAVDVAATGVTALGDVPVFDWFSHLYAYVYEDANRNGHHDAGEPGIPDQALNIRFRDGSIYQSLSTDDSGFKGFHEVFPFFAWLVAEVDYTRFHSTGVTVVVDNGGVASAANNWQTQAGLPPGLVPPNILNPQPQAENGGRPFRDESGAETPFLLLEGFQGFLGQSNVMLWGKAPYEKVGSFTEDVNVFPFDDFPGPGDFDANGDGFFNTDRSNGGIAGIVHYTITRAENDPRWAAAENWEPGVSDVRIQLWDENRTHLLNEVTTDNWNNSLPEGCQGPKFTFLGREADCYDGLRNFNQARPALFDGGYAFSTILQATPSRLLPGQTGEYGTNVRLCDPGDPAADPPRPAILTDCRDKMVPIPAGRYVVKMIVPPGYKVQKEEDKNVDFGDQYVPQQFWLSGYDLADAAASPVASLAGNVSGTQTTIALAAGGGKNVHPNDVINVDAEAMRVLTVVGDTIGVLRAQAGTTAESHSSGTSVFSHDAQPAPTVADNALIAPFCVGSLHTVPDELTLFPGVPSAFGGEQRPLCDAKLVTLREGQQAAPDFHLLTDAPKAGHIYGMVLDDTTNEFDPNAPTFGEKYAPPYMPIAIRDWQGRQVAHTYTDQYGMYNALVPSTYTIQVPQPSGVAPSILQACINSPTMETPDGQIVPDPLFQKQYSHFCYPLQYLPGKTTYLDTPVLPTGAFTGTGQFPVDAELPNRTPIIASVTGTEVAGPYIVDRGADPDKVGARTIVITSAGKVDVPNPAYGGAGSPEPKLITRDYGFGTQGGFVTLGGYKIPYTSWSDSQITAVVPTLPASPTVADISRSRTGELAVERCLAGKSAGATETTGTCNDGRKSVLGVTLNVATEAMHGARPPKVVAAGESIQAAIDAATAGDLILVQPGTYEEMVVMTKPVRLQGAGALSTIINVVTTPSENVQKWLDYVGPLLTADNGYLLPNQTAIANPANVQTGDVAAVLGDEGPGVLVLGKNDPTSRGLCSGSFTVPASDNEAYCLHNENSTGAEGVPISNLTRSGPFNNRRANVTTSIAHGFAPGSLITITGVNPNGYNGTFSVTVTDGTHFSYAVPGNPSANNIDVAFALASNGPVAPRWLRPNARIDGFSIVGANNAPGVLANGNNRYLEIANNKIYTNSGTYAGGIQLGHTGNPDLADENAHIWFAAIHNNLIAQNAGNDPNGGGGIVLGTGSGMYRVFENFVAANLAAGHGGGISHIGNTDNQQLVGEDPDTGDPQYASTPEASFVLPTYWGPTTDVPSNDTNVGVIDRNTIVFNESFSQGVGTNGGGIFVGGTPSPAGATTFGSGHVRISNNLIQGNAASGGDGGGVALLGLGSTTNGQARFGVRLYNNIIANNVAGFAGGGISLQDAGSWAAPSNNNPVARGPEIVHNTIVNNDSLSTAGLAFNVQGDHNRSQPMPAGIFMRCSGGGTCNGTPKITNSIVWHNRSYYFGVLNGGIQIPGQTATRGLIACGTGTLQPTACSNGFWDTGRSGNTSVSGNLTTNGTTTSAGAAPAFIKEYVNGDRRSSYQQTEVTTILVPAALDEGGNFIRPQFGPLSLTKMDDTRFSDYHLNALPAPVNGVALNSSTNSGGYASNVPAPLAYDIDAQPRPTSGATLPHRGADHVTGFIAAPVAVDDNASTDADVAVTINVLANDIGTSLVVTGVSSMVDGTAVINADNTITFTPDTGFNGQASFAYSISGIGGGSGALVTVNVGTPAPALSLSPAALNFANVGVGTTSLAQVVTVTNTGNASLSITGISLGGGEALSALAGAVSSGATSLTVQAGSGALFHVGDFIRVDDEEMSVTGILVDTVSVGRGAYGTTAASHALGAVVRRSVYPEYSATTCPASLPSGGTCSVSVTFHPTSIGTKLATLNVNVGAPAVSGSVSLSGTGLGAGLTVSPSSLAFGLQTVNQPSPAGVVTLVNTGNTSVQFSTAFGGADSGQFSVLHGCPAAPGPGSNRFVVAGGSCAVNVVFTPTSTGAKSATVTVTPSVGSATVVSLSGEGAAANVSRTPDALLFGNVTLGTPSAAQAVTVTNDGAAPVQLALTFSGTHASQFSQTGSCPAAPAALASHASCVANVVLTPTGPSSSAGPRSANLVVTPIGNPALTNVTLSGTAVTGNITASPTSLSFGSVAVGTTAAARTVTVTNIGAAPVAVTVSAITAFGTSVGQFTQTGNTCPAVLSNAVGSNTCTVSVTFNPTSTGNKTASFRVTPSNGTVRTVSLTGTGAASADLSITKDDGRTTVARQVQVSYTIVVTNNGPNAVSGAVVADTRPAAIPSWTWSCSPAGFNGCGFGNTGNGNINKTLGNLASGASVTITATGTVSSSASGNLVNTATVTAPSTTIDPNLANNSATDTDLILGTVAFSSATLPGALSGSTTRTLAFGNQSGSVTSTVTLTNTGGSAITFGNATVNNNQPGTAFSKGSDGCAGQTVAPAGTCTIVVNFNGPAGSVSSTGTLSVPSVAPNPASNNPAQLSLTGS